MSRSLVLVAVSENSDGSLSVQDANGQEHRVKNAQALWIALKQILSDESLPDIEEANPNEVEFEGAISDYVKTYLPPGLDRLAKPFVKSGVGLLQRLSKVHFSNHRLLAGRGVC